MIPVSLSGLVLICFVKRRLVTGMVMLAFLASHLACLWPVT